jgi:serine/threonine-protein kinase
VTDFGLAKLLTADSTATQSGAIAGTPSYMPPEQAAAKSELMGPRGDVYSLGAILYELLTGRPPFRAKTPLDTLVQVLESEPLPPRRLCPHIPREMELICLRCLEKAPEKRYASAAALADDLDRFLRREPVEARPPDLWHVLRRWSRRQPALASRLAALAVVAVIVQTSFHFAGTVSTRLHAQVMALLAGWAAVSIVFQRLLGNERWSLAARFAWAGADVLLLSAIFWLQGAFGTVLMAWYTLLLTASGLWVRERIVWFTTVLSAAAYAGLMLDAVQRGELPYPHHHAIFLASLPLLGFVVAYQVKRVRALSRFYERRS